MDFLRLVLLLGFAGALSSCNSSSSSSSGGSTTDSTWLSSFASGMAVSSPTAEGSNSLFFDSRSTNTIDSTSTLAQKAETLRSMASGEAATCDITLPALGNLGQSATCYGPTVNYTNHPDGGGGSGQLPSGDLGLWDATEGSTSTACVAAQLNKLVENVSAYVDASLMVQSSMLCLLTQNSVALPSVGEEYDATSIFSTSFTSANASATVSSAKVTRTESSTYLYEILGTTDGTKEFDLSIKIKKDSDTSYQGRIHGLFTTNNKDAFTAVFRRSDASLSVRLIAASWPSSVDKTSIFDSNNDIQMTSSWQGNMNQAIISTNLDTSVGNISYAWQAGSGDDKTRVFNAYTTASGDTTSGCGFFGYGNSFASDYSSNTNSIDGFICNWAGPGNDHSMGGTSGLSQKQCFEQTGGSFSEVAAKRAITYAPTVACNDSSALTYDWPSHSGDTATNDLITISSDTDYQTYSAPSAPTLDSGI